MSADRHGRVRPGPRRGGFSTAVAAVLVLVLAVTALGRGVTAAAAEVAAPTGFAGPICHAGIGAPAAPDRPSGPISFECCDACALLGPAILPLAPSLVERMAASSRAGRGCVAKPAPAPTRARLPQQARAPPFA